MIKNAITHIQTRTYYNFFFIYIQKYQNFRYFTKKWKNPRYHLLIDRGHTHTNSEMMAEIKHEIFDKTYLRYERFKSGAYLIIFQKFIYLKRAILMLPWKQREKSQ